MLDLPGVYLVKPAELFGVARNSLKRNLSLRLRLFLATPNNSVGFTKLTYKKKEKPLQWSKTFEEIESCPIETVGLLHGLFWKDHKNTALKITTELNDQLENAVFFFKNCKNGAAQSWISRESSKEKKRIQMNLFKNFRVFSLFCSTTIYDKTGH